MEISNIALQGLNQAQSQIEQAARGLAFSGGDLSNVNAIPVDTAQLSDTAVSLLAGKNQFSADIQLLKVADKMAAKTLDILA